MCIRDRAEDVGRALVQGHDGMSVPLSAVAEVVHRTGPPMIRSEDGRLTGFVFVDPGERAIGDWVAEARAKVAAGVSLPPGVRIEWVGQYRHFERAQARMAWVLPATLLLVFLLLYINTRSLPETLMVLLAVPFSLIGAVWLVWLLDFHMSVAVWVGLIALAGLDAETGVIMLLYLRLSWERWQREGRMDSEAALTEAIVEGAAHRIRPKLMTVLTLVVGLTPLLWSDGAGADVMKRIAAPMVGGLFTSFLLELTVYPACLLYTSPSPRDATLSRMPSSA